jgi:hypothetical protein
VNTQLKAANMVREADDARRVFTQHKSYQQIPRFKNQQKNEIVHHRLRSDQKNMICKNDVIQGTRVVKT